MRRLPLLTLLTLALFAALTAGWAWAQAAPSTPPAASHARTAVHAPLRAPGRMPREDAAQPGTYGFRTSQSIAARMTAADSTHAAPAADGGATVTVTAIVLPVVTIVADTGGVHEIWTNTPSRDPRGVLFAVREDIEGGETHPLDAATWAEARAALAQARAGTGKVWSK